MSVQSIEQVMTETITTTQLLEFLAKADKVSSHTYVTKRLWHGNTLYEIAVHCAWDDDNTKHYKQTTCITEEGHSTWHKISDYDFFTMDSVLDGLVKKEEEREMKRQKRQELLSRLTDEEKELLGVK